MLATSGSSWYKFFTIEGIAANLAFASNSCEDWKTSYQGFEKSTHIIFNSNKNTN